MSSVTLFMNSCWQGAFRHGTILYIVIEIIVIIVFEKTSFVL